MPRNHPPLWYSLLAAWLSIRLAGCLWGLFLALVYVVLSLLAAF